MAHMTRGKPATAGLPLALIVFLALDVVALSACSRRTDLSGDVYVMMQSGDVKRGADVEVVIIPSSAAYDEDLKALTASFSQEVDARQREIHASKVPLEAANKQKVAASIDAHVSLHIANRDLTDTVSDYQAKARAVIQRHARVSARTDVNGHFDIKNLERGKVYLFAEIKLFQNEVRWLVPVDLSQAAQKIDLSGSNSGWPFQLKSKQAS